MAFQSAPFSSTFVIRCSSKNKNKQTKNIWKQENTKRGKTDIIQYHLVKKANDLFPAHRTDSRKEEKEGGG